MMNKDLWDQIEHFDFDHPASEYDFSLRLANENYWTQNFTKLAILEYKKFMYLAAVSDEMVSPSEIIDTVWHQHLIFTKSYHEFCQILGKNIQHIPSTHSKEDFQKFKIAKDRTSQLYKDHFGNQPNDIWSKSSPFESLNLKKSGFKLRTAINIGILSFILLSFPLYFLLKPLYLAIPNPYFIILYVGLIIISLTGLEWYNKRKFDQAINLFDKNSFAFNLEPYELIYFRNRNILSIIHGSIHELIDNNSIQITANKTIAANLLTFVKSKEQRQVIDVLKDLGTTTYTPFLLQLIGKPVFSNIKKSMDQFAKYFNRSKSFSNLFVFNFIAFLILTMTGFLRIVNGIFREKPIVQISFAVIFIIFLMIGYLYRLTHLLSRKFLPYIYRKEILSKRNNGHDWQWSYFLMGTAVLTTSFTSLATSKNSDSTSGSSETSSSSDSSCSGSSCSSCGGCGGGGD